MISCDFLNQLNSSWILERKVLSQGLCHARKTWTLHPRETARRDSLRQEVVFYSLESSIFMATACFPGGLTGETMAYVSCCTCAAPLPWSEYRAPADKSSVRWPYQSASLPGLTNNTFFSFSAGNSVLVINTGQSCPVASAGAYLCTFPFTVHPNQSSYFYYKPLLNPFLENLKDCSPCLHPKCVTTRS